MDVQELRRPVLATGDLGTAPRFADTRIVDDPSACFFYHTLDLPRIGTVEGGWDLRGRFADYTGHVDVRRKRVLDVGTASGFLSFEAERAGAADVVSFDLDNADRQHLLPFAGSEYVTDHASWSRKQTALFMQWKNGYWLAHRLLGSQARMVYGDVYRLPAWIGRFDVVILGAILEHLIDPLSALRSVADVTDDLLVINTDYFDTEGPAAYFVGRADAPANSFTFWVYSIAIYDEYMKIMGFERVTAHKDTFAGTRPAPDAPRPMLPRVALVYRRTR